VRAIARSGTKLVRAEAPPRAWSWKRQTVPTSGLVFVSAIAGGFTQAVLAATLGLSGAADAFLAAVALSLFATYVMHTSVLNREVPRLSALLDPEHEPTRAFWARIWSLTRWVAAISAVLGGILFVGADWAVELIAPGLPPGSHALAVESVRIMSLPLAIQLSASGCVAALHTLRGQPLIQSTALLYSAALILALVYLTPIVGPVSAAVGAATAYCLMFAVVVLGTLWLARRGASSFEPSGHSVAGTSITLVPFASVVLFGQTLIGPVLASTLAEGTVAQLAFAYRPIEVVSRGLPVVIAATLMPALAAAHAGRGSAHVAALAFDALRLTLALVLPTAALLIALREPVVLVLYQRAAFSVEAAQAVTPTLGWYAAALPGMGLVVVVTSIFFAVGRERWALLLALAILGGYAALGLMLGRALGGVGLAVGFCLANLLGAVVGVAAAGHLGHEMLWTGWWRWMVPGAVMALIGGTVGVELTRSLSPFVQLVVGAVLGGAWPMLILLRLRMRGQLRY
jgi:putative peptidoglycan lipid II flippase